MAEVLSEQNSVLGQGCVAAGMVADQFRIEKCHTVETLAVEVNCILEKGHAEQRSRAAEVYTVVTNIDAVDTDAGSCVLVGAVDTVAVCTAGLTGLVDSAHIVELPAGPVELAGTAASVGLGAVADDDVLGIVDYAGTVAQDNLVDAAEFDTVGSADTVGSVDTAVVADTVDLVHTVEIVDNAELAAGTVDTVAATERQPYLIAPRPRSYFCWPQKGRDTPLDHGDACQESKNP